jgi:hypothetical protein
MLQGIKGDKLMSATNKELMDTDRGSMYRQRVCKTTVAFPVYPGIRAFLKRLICTQPYVPRLVSVGKSGGPMPAHQITGLEHYTEHTDWRDKGSRPREISSISMQK